MFYLIQLLNSVQYGLLLFLLASGLTLIFGIMGVINLAHGSFYMVGAYLAYWLAKITGSFWLAIPLGLVIALGLGVVLETTLVSRLYKRDHLYQVLLTFGLILIFEELQEHPFRRRRAWRGSAGVAQLFGSSYGYAVLSCLSALYHGRLLVARGSDVLGDPQDPPRHDDSRGQQQPRNGGLPRREYSPPIRAGIRLRHGARRVCRHDCRADIVGVSRHGQSDSDHLLCGRGDRRHRLHQRRDDCVAGDRIRRHPRQSARSGILRHRRLPFDGRHPFVAAPRACQQNVTRTWRTSLFPASR